MTLFRSVAPKAILDDLPSALTQDYETDTGLTRDEVQALLSSHDSLDKYSRRSDCFRRGAGFIRSRCGQLDMDEDERVKAAISMTLCELATARPYSPPLECASFSIDSPNFDAPAQSHLQGDCVNALSRSAQFWSSYSGYLREVPQLCFAFRRWNDIDTAKDIYKNATLEKIALIRFLLARERSVGSNMRVLEHHLTEMRDLLTNLHAASGGIKGASDNIVSRCENGFEDSLNTFRYEIAEFQRRSEDVHLRSITQLDSSLSRISQQHASALASLVSTVESSFIAQVDAVFSLTRNQHQNSLDLAASFLVFYAWTVQTHARRQQNRLSIQWTDLSRELTLMRQSIVEISEIASQTILVLETSSGQAHFIRQTQFEVSSSVSSLVDTIKQLTATAHGELERINGSAFSLIQRLDAHGNGARWRRELLRMMEVVLRGKATVDPASLQFFSHFPIFRVFLMFSSLLFYIFRTTLVALMRASVVLISSRKHTATHRILSSNSLLLEGQPQVLQHSAATSVHFCTDPGTRPCHYRCSSGRRIHNKRSIGPGRMSRIPDRLCNPNLVSC